MIRLAIYFSPAPGTRLAERGEAWLGRDRTGAAVNGAAPPGINLDRYVELIGQPAHYGFHGTIKPPFRLAPETTIEQVARRLEQFAGEQKKFFLPPLELSRLQGFFCLRPNGRCPALQQLAERAVRSFDDFRLPPPREELDKRRRDGLTRKQEVLLHRWGYPYVMDQFRFHLTLTDRITDPLEEELLEHYLSQLFPGELLRSVAFDALSLFVELSGSRMWEIRRFPFRR